MCTVHVGMGEMNGGLYNMLNGCWGDVIGGGWGELNRHSLSSLLTHNHNYFTRCRFDGNEDKAWGGLSQRHTSQSDMPLHVC